MMRMKRLGGMWSSSRVPDWTRATLRTWWSSATAEALHGKMKLKTRSRRKLMFQRLTTPVLSLDEMSTKATKFIRKTAQGAEEVDMMAVQTAQRQEAD